MTSARRDYDREIHLQADSMPQQTDYAINIGSARLSAWAVPTMWSWQPQTQPQRVEDKGRSEAAKKTRVSLQANR